MSSGRFDPNSLVWSSYRCSIREQANNENGPAVHPFVFRQLHLLFSGNSSQTDGAGYLGSTDVAQSGARLGCSRCPAAQRNSFLQMSNRIALVLELGIDHSEVVFHGRTRWVSPQAIF